MPQSNSKTRLGSHARWEILLFDFKQFWIFSTDFLIEVTNNKFRGNLSSGCSAEAPGQTDMIKQGKVHPCRGTEALYRPYGP